MIMFSLVERENKDRLSLETIVNDVKIKKGKIGFMIGPEGGFSPIEEKIATEAGIQIVQVFENVLRTETASIALTSIMRYLVDKKCALVG